MVYSPYYRGRQLSVPPRISELNPGLLNIWSLSRDAVRFGFPQPRLWYSHRGPREGSLIGLSPDFSMFLPFSRLPRGIAPFPKNQAVFDSCDQRLYLRGLECDRELGHTSLSSPVLGPINPKQSKSHVLRRLASGWVGNGNHHRG